MLRDMILYSTLGLLAALSLSALTYSFVWAVGISGGLDDLSVQLIILAIVLINFAYVLSFVAVAFTQRDSTPKKLAYRSFNANGLLGFLIAGMQFLFFQEKALVIIIPCVLVSVHSLHRASHYSESVASQDSKRHL